ncbi:NotI family restriction endonuclease [Propioniferax innocua]|uniref:NotI family restriction endonuclease n=1 Tax=Propioniferax innocua TaxID=1753 RepID=UPI001151AD46
MTLGKEAVAVSWGIAEWYGKDIRRMSAKERADAASVALETNEKGMEEVEQPRCPFLDSARPGARCNKPGGVCSIRSYEGTKPKDDEQPAAVCPNRFLELVSGQSVFARIAKDLYGRTSGAKVIKEIPFLHKVDAKGEVNRSAKAGRIDWVLVPEPPAKGASGSFDWVAVETQAVYFSGGNMWVDIEQYRKDPAHLHAPQAQRRPDYRSSGAKRLAPQLDAKAPVIRRWGKKVVVIIDQSFYGELATLPTKVDDFDNAEVVWVIMRYTDAMNLVVDKLFFGLLDESIQALQATRPLNKAEFESGLKEELWRTGKKSKVHDA